jgi:hypothetical protein
MNCQMEETLDHCLEQCAAEGIRLEELVGRLGTASYCFLCMILSVPFIQPLSLGPLTMLSGVVFVTVGWQMAHGHETPRLPAKAADYLIHGKGWTSMLKLCRFTLRFCRKFTRERYPDWVYGEQGMKRVGWLVTAGGALLFIPTANIPFNNTFPALMIFFAVLGWLEKDGFMVIVSLFWGMVALLYFTVILAALWFMGSAFWEWLPF